MGGNFLEWQKLRKIKPSKIKSFLLQKPYKPILPLDKLIHGAYTYPGTGKCKPLQYNTVVFPETVSIKTTYALKLFNCFKSMKNLYFFLFYHCWRFSGFEQKISVTEEEKGAWKTQINKYNQQAHGKFGKKKKNLPLNPRWTYRLQSCIISPPYSCKEYVSTGTGT